MKEMFDGLGNIIREGDIVECCPGREESTVPYTDHLFAGDLIAGEVRGFTQGYVKVLGMRTRGNWVSGTSLFLTTDQVVSMDYSNFVDGFNLNAFNQMLGIMSE